MDQNLEDFRTKSINDMPEGVMLSAKEIFQQLHEAFYRQESSKVRKLFTLLAVKYDFAAHEDFWKFLKALVEKEKPKALDFSEVNDANNRLEDALERLERAFDDAQSYLRDAQDMSSSITSEIEYLDTEN